MAVSEHLNLGGAGLPPMSTAHSLKRVFLGEVFLGFLAIVAAVFTAIPMLFPISPGTNWLLETGQWSIIGLFAAEYLASLAAATSKKSFVLSPWRLVDAATILIPLLTLLPGASQLLRSSPVLRLVRIARVVALGARAGGVMTRQEGSAVAAQDPGSLTLRVLPEGQTLRNATWEEFVHWAKHREVAWFSLSNVGRHNVADVARASGLDADFISSHLLGTSYPHVECDENSLVLFAWVPRLLPGGQVERNGLLLLAGNNSVITLSRRPAHLMEKVAAQPARQMDNVPFAARIALQLLKTVLEENESVIGRFEDELRSMEDLPIRDSRPQFFERTFRLKRELSAAQADLWRLRGVLRELSDGRTQLPGGGGASGPFLIDLVEAADYLYETVNNIREGILSLLELHLNVVSFEMNRVMRVLAVVSVLGLIPAVIGGLFGMNLVDNPWPFTLPQVTFAVVTGMVTCLYFFVVKGWLR